MQLFFHDVGIKGSTRDFPKTVFGDVTLHTIEQHVPIGLKRDILDTLTALYHDVPFNCWGVPAGAESVINRLNVGDGVLLIRTTAGDGDIPALCIVDAYWKEPMLSLSRALWGSENFPFIFFFKTERIELTWSDLKNHIGYAPNFRPSGNVYRINPDRLDRFGGPAGYLDLIRMSPRSSFGNADLIISEPTLFEEYAEGVRLTRERSYFKRHPDLVRQAKSYYGTTCQVCGFNFSEKYGEIGEGYIECHHLNPLSERIGVEEPAKTTLDDVRVVCANCHRMIHRRQPALTIEELRAAIGKERK